MNTGAPRIVALLSGNADLDRGTGEAVVRVDPEARAESEAGAALEAIGPRTRLVVVDLAQPDLDIDDLVRRLEAPEDFAPPAILLVLPSGTAEPADAVAHGHYIGRPVRPETLTALCHALVQQQEAEIGAIDSPTPVVRARRPARFSARPLHGEAVRFVNTSFERARDGVAPDPNAARLLAEKFHTSLRQGNLLLLRALEPYPAFELPVHCVNVAIIAAKIALGLDLPLEDTLRVIQAGLLHDIGMAYLPVEVLEKEGPLSEDERLEVRRHPLYGAEILARLGEPFEWLRRAVRQEHERWNGEGYPEGLTGDDIDPIARILGLADVFEALSHMRHYRTPFSTYEALERVLALREEQFAARIVDALADEISVFPLDSYVQLSDGQIGRVASTNPENLLRPLVEVLWNERWEPLEESRRISLADTPDLSIARPLHESEVPIT
jgi:putative nucleotidyltransferase with HDIG domain